MGDSGGAGERWKKVAVGLAACGHEPWQVIAFLVLPLEQLVTEAEKPTEIAIQCWCGTNVRPKGFPTRDCGVVKWLPKRSS